MQKKRAAIQALQLFGRRLEVRTQTSIHDGRDTLPLTLASSTIAGKMTELVTTIASDGANCIDLSFYKTFLLTTT